MYVQQTGYYPGCVAGGTSLAIIWPTRLRPFTGRDQRVFYCPAQDERCEWKSGDGPSSHFLLDQFGYEPGDTVLRNLGTWFSYGYNWAGSDEPTSDRPRGLGAFVWTDQIKPEMRPVMTEVAAARVRRPAEMIAIGDGTADAVLDGILSGGMYYRDSTWPGTIHRGGANILFCDGHVTWYAQGDLVDWNLPDWHLRQRMWHVDNEP